MATLIIKTGTTQIAGSTVKGSFSYFSANTTLDLGPTSVTGFYSGIDAPTGGFTVYQVGGSNGWTARVAQDATELNSILVAYGATGSTLDQRINWATNTNSVFINSGNTNTVTVTNYEIDFTGYDPQYVASLTVDPLNSVYSVSSDFFLRSLLSKITSGGTFTQNFTTLPEGYIAQSIACDASSNLYVCDLSYDIIKVDSSGNITNPWYSVTGTTSGIIRVLVDSQNNVYALSDSDEIVKITQGGVQSIFGTVQNITNAVFDKFNSMYITSFNTGVVTKITSGGTQTTLATLTNDQPNSITVDSQGNVYTANYAANTITKITSGGTVTNSWVTPPYTQPAYITTDTSDNLYVVYVSAGGANKVSKITSAGVITSDWATTASPGMSSIISDTANNIYVGNDNYISKISQ